MNLEEWKNIWLDHDKKLDKHIKLNIEQIKKLNLDNTRSELDDFLRTPLYGLVIGIALQIFLIYFIVNHINMLEFVAPAVLINTFVILQIIISVFQASVILKLNYNSPITDIQKKLGWLNLRRIRYLTTTRFSYPLLCVPVLIVGSKAIFNVDLYLYLEPWWIWLQVGIGVIFLMFGLWLSMQYATQKINSTLLKRLMANITRNDMTGKSLSYAISILNDIEKFEKEA
jgi:hypothetical protein